MDANWVQGVENVAHPLLIDVHPVPGVGKMAEQVLVTLCILQKVCDSKTFNLRDSRNFDSISLDVLKLDDYWLGIYLPLSFQT